MKTHLKSLFSMVLFLSGCATTPIFTPSPVVETTQMPVVASPTVTTATSTSAALPDDLVVGYIAEDALWIWKQGNSQLLLQQENIYAPHLSDDGQWILFKQHHMFPDENPPFEELWVVRTDGSELYRLLGPDDLVAVTGEKRALYIFDADWLPDSHRILFNPSCYLEMKVDKSP